MNGLDWVLAWALAMWIRDGLMSIASAIRYHRDSAIHPKTKE